MKGTVKAGILLFAVASSSFLASCSSKITAEQLAEIRRLRAQEQSLQQQKSDKQNELNRLKNEVSARQKEVDDCNTRKQFVQTKLAQWPNVWPAGLFPND